MRIADLHLKKRLDYWVGTPLVFLLNPIAYLLGQVLKRDHQSTLKGRLVLIKMLGGGSLLIALPALLGLRQKYPQQAMDLVTTNDVKAFAEQLGIFDRILVVNDRSLLSFAWSALQTWRRIWRSDAILDLEVFSRLSTTLSLISASRNRLGFYLNDFALRKNVYTHLTYFNRFGPVYRFYAQLVSWLGAEAVSWADAQKAFALRVDPDGSLTRTTTEVAWGPFCSHLSPERKLKANQWKTFFQKTWSSQPPARVHVLGAGSDQVEADELIAHMKTIFPPIEWINHCGKTKLNESYRFLKTARHYYGIDSSLLHAARLLNTPSTSFWGPTNPANLLAPIPGLDETIFYEKVSCSPCIHVTENPPCRGQNICIDQLFDPSVHPVETKGTHTAWPPL